MKAQNAQIVQNNDLGLIIPIETGYNTIMAHTKSYLDPYTLIRKSKHLHLCTPLARGAAIMILLDWFHAGCPDLGLNPSYARIVGIRSCDWDNHKDSILRVFQEVMPELLRLNDKRKKRIEKRQIGALNMRTKHAKKKQESDFLTDAKSFHAPVNPVNFSAKKWNEGRSDQTDVQRAKAKKRTELAGVTFTDKHK